MSFGQLHLRGDWIQLLPRLLKDRDRDSYRRMIRKIKRFPGFLKEVREELKKVSWSSRQELTAAATIVVITTSLLTAYIALVDLGLSRLVQILLR